MNFFKYLVIVLTLAVVSVFWFNNKEPLSFERPIPLKFSENLREDYRKLPFTGAHNFRDLGGYKTEDGRTVKWGKIYRSDNLHSLTDEDLKSSNINKDQNELDINSLAVGYCHGGSLPE